MMRGPQNSRGWILPLCRIVRELGVFVMWDIENFDLLFPCGRIVSPVEDEGLRYIRADDLFFIRKKLLKSHHEGRPAAKETAKTTGVVCNSIEVPSQNYALERSILASESEWEKEEIQCIDWAASEKWEQDNTWVAKAISSGRS